MKCINLQQSKSAKILLCAALFALIGVRLSAQSIQPPVTVPDKSSIASDAPNLLLKKDLDQRYQTLQQRFQTWNREATAFNAQYGGRDFNDHSAEAAAGLAAQTKLSKALKSYQHDLQGFNADIAKLAKAPILPPAVTEIVASKNAESQPALQTGEEIIDAMNALAQRLGWSPERQAHFDQELKKLGYLRSTDSPEAIHKSWENILRRGPDSVFAKEAATGGGPGFAGAGKQTAYSDCAIFALANATGRPYEMIAASATDQIRQGEWHSGTDRANPQQAIEQKGLNGGEVLMLAETFGQGEMVPDNDFKNTLKEGRPVLVSVVPSGGYGAHEVALTKTFQHEGETWYEMMESYNGPQRRLYLSAKELNGMQKENGVAYRKEAHRTPQLLREAGDQRGGPL